MFRRVLKFQRVQTSTSKASKKANPGPDETRKDGQSDITISKTADGRSQAGLSSQSTNLPRGWVPADDIQGSRPSLLGCHVLYDPPPEYATIADIVFVHGLTGDSLNTWSYKSSGKIQGAWVHWPSNLLKHDIPDVRILSFGYDADVVGLWAPASTNSASNHAENLLGRLTSLREKTSTEERPLLFVMHSLGGLIVQNALELSRSSPEQYLRKLEVSTIGLCFMGTPNLGSDKAEWGSVVATILDVVKKTNKPIVKLLKPDSETLAAIQKRFHGILRMRQSSSCPIEVTCFYEEIPMIGIGTVVERSSAIIPGYPSYGIHANHQNMVQFRSARDQGYESVLGELMRWVKMARSRQSEATELQEECLRSLYFTGLDAWEAKIEPPLNGTASWIWESNLGSWLIDGRGLFWIQGKAASGKSTLVKYIVETTKSDPKTRLTAISYHISKSEGDAFGRTKQGIARALLWKLLKECPQYFPRVVEHFKHMKMSRTGVNWEHSHIYKALLSILAETPLTPIWVFIDGLDECLGDLLDIVDMCSELVEAAAENVRICVASRPEKELAFCLSSNQLSAANNLVLEEHTAEDIEICVQQEINRVSRLLTKDVEAHLISTISQQARGFFMWAKLASRDIGRSYMKHHTPDHERHLRLLNLLPKECGDLYQEILRRRDGSDDYEEAMVMLAIVARAKRSLRLEEFDKIARVPGHFLHSSSLQLTQKGIEWSTGGLLEIRSDQVAFSHGTVAAFTDDLLSQKCHYRFLQEAMSKLARACLDVQLSMTWSPELFNEQKNEDGSVLVLQEYAIQHWFHHVEEARNHAMLSNQTGWFNVPASFVNLLQRAYLARCWNFQAPSIPRFGNVLSTTLAHVLLSRLPIFELAEVDINFDNVFNTDFNTPGAATSPSQQKIEKPAVLITIQSSGNYHLSFLSTEVLNSDSDSIDCIVTSVETDILSGKDDLIATDKINATVSQIRNSMDRFTGAKDYQKHTGQTWQDQRVISLLGSVPRPPTQSKRFPELSQPSPATLYHNHPDITEDVPGMQVRDKNITLDSVLPLIDLSQIPPRYFSCPMTSQLCLPSRYEMIPLPRAKLHLDPELFAQVQDLVRDFCRSVHTVQQNPQELKMLGDKERLVNMSPAAAISSGVWVTPMHYAAYHGLDLIVKDLHTDKAANGHVRADSRFGSALMAAIWGAYEMPHLRPRDAVLSTLLELDKNRVGVNLACNSGRLGEVTPIFAAVRLYSSNCRRSGHQSDRLRAVISILIDNGAVIDNTTRAIMRTYPDLKLLLGAYDRDASSVLSGGSMASWYSTMPELASERVRWKKANNNASISYLLPSSRVQSSGYFRMAGTFN